MSIDDTYQVLLDEQEKLGPILSTSNSDNDLLPDNLTEQQRERDQLTTLLYKQFISVYGEKQGYVKSSKKTIRNWCIVWVSALVITFVVLTCYILFGTGRKTGDIIALISAAIPILAAIIGTLNIVTKHVFPEDEERHITEIVKTILNNDLQNKIENLKKPGSSSIGEDMSR